MAFEHDESGSPDEMQLAAEKSERWERTYREQRRHAPEEEGTLYAWTLHPDGWQFMERPLCKCESGDLVSFVMNQDQSWMMGEDESDETTVFLCSNCMENLLDPYCPGHDPKIKFVD